MGISYILIDYVMKSLVFLIALFAAAKAAPSKPLTIVGGEDAEDAEFPWQIQLRSSSSDRSLFCGGWVLNENWVGTAAHCCVGKLPRGVHVVAGGILRVEDDEGEEQFSDVTDCIVTGWGTLHSGDFLLPDKLQKVTVPIVGDATCDDLYNRNEITDSMICAGDIEQGGIDSCQGDSGGPMIDAKTKVLVGVVSWGIGCADAKHPGVYTEVAYFVDWINEKVAA